MRILHVNSSDSGGGAELVAFQMVSELRARGHDAQLAVGRKTTTEPWVIDLDAKSTAFERLCASWIRRINHRRGLQQFYSPVTSRLPSFIEDPQLIHAHNLHGAKGYFDLRALPSLSARVPFFMTLHDAWLLTGHCAHSLNCDRWKTGCGECPDLTIYPALRRDATGANWQSNREIFSRSKLYIATPSTWLMKRVEQSSLARAIVEAKVIPNGIDANIFKPGDRRDIRRKLSWPEDAFVVLFNANALRASAFRDAAALQTALKTISAGDKSKRCLFIGLGATNGEEISGIKVTYVPYQSERPVVADYLRAADVFLHAARADTFPTVIIEAQATGCIPIATATGGIADQIENGVNGFLAPQGDGVALGNAALQLASDRARSQTVAANAASHAATRFNLDLQMRRYIDWYESVLSRAPRNP